MIKHFQDSMSGVGYQVSSNLYSQKNSPLIGCV